MVSDLIYQHLNYTITLDNPGITSNASNFMMENEELLAGDPDVAQLHTRETRTGDVNENTPLIDEADSLLHQQPVYVTDSRPKWRKPSVSDYGLRQQRQEQLSNLQT